MTGYLTFPYAAQVFCIQRDVTEIVTGKFRSESVYGLTSLTPQKGRPARLLTLNRNHWSIENRFHWIRDVTFDEDRCQIRKGAGAQVMAGLRNLALSLLRMAGVINIAQALRHWARQGLLVLRFLGLTVA